MVKMVHFCNECGQTEDTIQCSNEEIEEDNREEVEEKLGQQPDERNIIRIMTESRKNWITVETFLEEIIERKENEE
ncbi:hypothetical protein Zmor_002291 [Zophobas morio]|uniref:Uncharacterized protein n=1 Tax=Zophobas morio TaxID=2755281 RepID=A0AA38MTX9_9CUCU|nr:hypothetical protein Zmor_002291 [Zophobas morio]